MIPVVKEIEAEELNHINHGFQILDFKVNLQRDYSNGGSCDYKVKAILNNKDTYDLDPVDFDDDNEYGIDYQENCAYWFSEKTQAQMFTNNFGFDVNAHTKDK